MAVYPLEYVASRKGRQTYTVTETGTIATGDSVSLTLAGNGHGSILLRHILVTASGGTATEVNPAAYLDAALTASGQVWAGTWVGTEGLTFAAGEGDGAVLPLDEDGIVWIHPGLDASVTSVTVTIQFEAL